MSRVGSTRRILFISPLDRHTVANTREENIAAACRERGYATLSLTLAQNTSRALRDLLRDAFTWRVTRSADAMVVRVDPLLNPCTGLHSNVLCAQQAQPSFTGRLRSWVLSLLAPLGVLRDVAIIPAFLFYALRCGRFDICIAYGPWACCVGWLLRRLGRVGVVVYDDQDYEPAIMRNPVRRSWAIILERSMMRRADVVVSVGYRLAALRRQQTACPVEVIPNGVRDVVSVAVARTTRENPRFTLIYVGNVVNWSGLDEMLAGLPEVLAAGVRPHFLIVGDGLPAYVTGLRRRVEALALQQLVTFVGRVPNERIGEWLARADAGLAHFRPEPYRRYAFPLKVVEYMAAGLAVIGTRDTETEDILRRHGNGISVDFDRHAIAAAILQFAREPELLAACRARSRLAARDYQWSLLAARELALAESAAARVGRVRTA